MNKFLVVALMATSLLWSHEEIPLQKVQKHRFAKSLGVNAKVIQLSNASQAVTSQVAGHLERYYVTPGEVVAKGKKIAVISSMEIAKMSADFISLKEQYKVAKERYMATKKLYDKGMTSMNELSQQEVRLSQVSSQLQALRSQLETVGINTKNLHKATAKITLYAHATGKVAQLLKPLHSSVDASEPIVTLVKQQAYYIQSYIPLEYATKIAKGDKIVASYGGRKLLTHITQILPEIDEQTQRVIVLSSVDEDVKHLFIGSFVEAVLYFGKKEEYLSVKKSALSFFQNEWVVFVPKEEDAEDAPQHAHEEDEEAHEHEEEHHHETPYVPVVVEILAEDETYVAVDGLQENQEYVSDKSYYVKSMLLKSSLGEHGH